MNATTSRTRLATLALVCTATMVSTGCGASTETDDSTLEGTTPSAVETGDAAQTGSTIPDGIYRANVTVESLAEAGVPANEATGNGGVQTITAPAHRSPNRRRCSDDHALRQPTVDEDRLGVRS